MLIILEKNFSALVQEKLEIMTIVVFSLKERVHLKEMKIVNLLLEKKIKLIMLRKNL